MYAEIRNNYAFGPGAEPGSTTNGQGDLFAGIAIDAWKTPDDNEPGEVIAQVLMTTHGDTVIAWHDNGARLNRRVLEAIDEAKTELKQLYDDSRKTEPAAGADTEKIYRLTDDEGELDIIIVHNWDDRFDQALTDVYAQWQSSQNEFHSEIYGRLAVLGYDIDIVEAETICL